MKGQVWIETALYTLIGLSLIGIVLAFALPKIKSSQEKTIIEQTISSIEDLNERIESAVVSGPGNRRIYSIQFKKGLLKIDDANESIIFELNEMNSPYSEPGVKIEKGKLDIISQEEQKGYRTYLILDYSAIDLVVPGGNKNYPPAATPYRFSIYNNGTISGKTAIILSEV